MGEIVVELTASPCLCGGRCKAPPPSCAGSRKHRHLCLGDPRSLRRSLFLNPWQRPDFLRPREGAEGGVRSTAGRRKEGKLGLLWDYPLDQLMPPPPAQMPPEVRPFLLRQPGCDPPSPNHDSSLTQRLFTATLLLLGLTLTLTLSILGLPVWDPLPTLADGWETAAAAA